MLAVHLENGCVSIRNKPLPRRGKGSALIRLRCAGICNTDLELLRGYYGFRGTPGHEFVGQVVEADSTKLVGRRVVGEINIACGRCEWCAQGLEKHCPARSVLGIARHPGAFSEYFTLPEKNLHLVPDSMTDEQAVFTEPLAAALKILDQVKIPKGAPVAVLGDGKLGLLIAQALYAAGAQVKLYGHHRNKLQIAARAGVAVEWPRKRVPRAIYDWVVEATGSAGGLNEAIQMTRPRGTVVVKSTIHEAVQLEASAVVVNEITLVGSRCGRFAPALRLLRSGKIRVEEMIASRFPLAEAPQAFAVAGSKGTLKVLLQCDF